MSDIYIIYRPSEQVGGYVEKLGSYMNYFAGRIDELYIDGRIEISKINATVVDKDVALGWLFADAYSGRVSIKGETPAAKQMESVVGKLELGEKVKYDLTEEDKKNGALFHEALLNKIVEEGRGSATREQNQIDKRENIRDGIAEEGVPPRQAHIIAGKILASKIPDYQYTLLPEDPVVGKYYYTKDGKAGKYVIKDDKPGLDE